MRGLCRPQLNVSQAAIARVRPKHGWPSDVTHLVDKPRVPTLPMRCLCCSRKDACAFGSRFQPVHLAAMGKHARVLRALIDAGANPGALDEYGDTPLYVAARQLSPECVAVLVGGAHQSDSKTAAGRLCHLSTSLPSWHVQTTEE